MPAFSACRRNREDGAGKTGGKAGTAAEGTFAEGTSELTGPRRIISAAPSNTEIIIGLGLGDRIIAADKYSLALPGLPAGIREIDFFYPDPEAILGLGPDIIISSETNAYGGGANPYKPLEDSGITLLFIPTSRGIADIKRDIGIIAGALGAGDRGEELVRTMEGEIEEVAAVGRSLAGPSFKPKTVYLEISPFPDPVTAGRETFLDEMLGIIGAVNVFADRTGWIAPGAEAILERDPEVILTSVNFLDDPVGEIKARPGFAGLGAIREGRVYVIDADSSSRPSQHITLALRQMALAVYPEEYAGLTNK
ncbi:MAG: ABC transporter substrate-binding protein [Treponema sp.]|nr:ABC transporter substrate-binding protein [Treponema sp.]